MSSSVGSSLSTVNRYWLVFHDCNKNIGFCCDKIVMNIVLLSVKLQLCNAIAYLAFGNMMKSRQNVPNSFKIFLELSHHCP